MSATEPLRVLCVNGGSSSLKCALFALDEHSETVLVRVALDGVGSSTARLRATATDGEQIADRLCAAAGQRQALTASLDLIEELGHPRIAAAGHRVVHGGPRYAAPVLIDAEVLDVLAELAPFAPLHLPAAVATIEAVGERYPGAPRVACFDTGFHRHMPEVARRLPLPVELWNAGVRRYGFHGLSYEYVVATVGADVLGRAVLAHLGNGASMVAVRDGASVDTTMGLTPTGGLVMSTRSGDLDPGVLTYLSRAHQYDGERLERLVDQEAGLLALSETSSDMRTLLESRERDPRARLAVDVFCLQASKHAAALSAVLGGLDTLVFTGGIGERAAAVRSQICRRLEHLGVHIDEERNRRHADVISATQSRCTVRVVQTDEDLMIARHTRALVQH